MDLPLFITKYPRITACLSFLLLLEGLWGLFSGDPLIPSLAKGVGVNFTMITWLSPIFPAAIAILGLLLLIVIFWNTTKKNEIVQRPEIKFGLPVQDAGESNVSWWHIPISLSVLRAKEVRMIRYDDCKARLIFIGQTAYPASIVDLVCRKADAPRGVHEFSLVLGDEPRRIPIAIRWDYDFMPPEYCAGDTFITGLAHQFQSFRFKLPTGEYRFKIEIRCGGEKWESGQYLLRVPKKDASNGHFILSTVET